MIPVFDMPLFSDIILVSVSLGLIGTILGAVSLAGSRLGSKGKENKSSKGKKGA